jgi:type IV secretion system protein VirB6
MAIICFQAPSLASALTGGAAMQQGVQMIQNAMMVAGLRSGPRSGRGGAADAAGGAVRAGAGIPYAAGHATGAAAAAVGRMARQGMGAARIPAYKRAAMRSRD